MKHANDPGTIEMFDAPKRRGRPPQGKVALTPAERAKRYRAKRADRAGTTFSDPAGATVAQLCKALQELHEFTPQYVHPVTAGILGKSLAEELVRRFDALYRNDPLYQQQASDVAGNK